MKPTFAYSLALLATTLIGAGGAMAQQAAFELELNNVKPAEIGCRLTYVARNSTGADIESIGFEMVVFDAEGMVDRRLNLEFGAFPDGKTKVLQFDIAGQQCDAISRLLINDAAECTVSEGDAPDCLGLLVPSNRTALDFGI